MTFSRISYSVALLLVIAAGLAGGRLLGDYTASAENVPTFHNKAMYDSTTSGISSNVQEKFCVYDFTDDPDFNASTWQTTIAGWLNESSAWESIGTNKVDFVSNCSSPNTRIEFYDLDDPEWTCGGGACAPYVSGSASSTDGHNHYSTTAIRVGTPFWTCNDLPPGAGCWSTDTDKERVINHEMGHMVGLDHNGPVQGITSGNGGLYDEFYDTGPADNEVYQARGHLNGRSSPSLHACLGFPEDDEILVSWFDTANDDTSNLTSMWKWTGGWNQIFSMSQGSVSGAGSRVNFLSGTRSDIDTSVWIGRADVTGGPRNQQNWDPALWTQVNGPSTYEPDKPCTFTLTATGSGNVSLNWKDGSFNENKWHIYYSISSGYGALGTWNYRGYCNGADLEGCGDSASFTTLFDVGDRLCARLTAGNGNGQSGSSNIACTTVQ